MTDPTLGPRGGCTFWGCIVPTSMIVAAPFIIWSML